MAIKHEVENVLTIVRGYISGDISSFVAARQISIHEENMDEDFSETLNFIRQGIFAVDRGEATSEQLDVDMMEVTLKRIMREIRYKASGLDVSLLRESQQIISKGFSVCI